MEIPQETEDYIRESIESSVGLPISEKTFRLKLLASEDERHLLQDQIFILQDQLRESHKRLQGCKEEASMNAHGLKKCIQERETMALKYGEMEKYCEKLERECLLYERDLEKVMESCDELEKDNNELRAQLQDNSSSLCAEVKSLQEDKENLLINLQRAEQEVKKLYEVNRLLDEENKRLLDQLKREKKHQHSATGSSARGKRKSILWQESGCNTLGREGEFNMEEQLREALTPLQHNSPESRILKK